jgi:dodecin
MSSDVYKAVDLVGTSGESFDDAARMAVRRAGETLRDLQWMEVLEQRGYIKGGEVKEFQVKVRIWFGLEHES